MWWLFKKLIFLAVVVGLVVYALQYKIQGRPVKDHIVTVIQSPLFRTVTAFAKEKVIGYFKKDLQDASPMEEVKEEEKRELQKVLEEESRE